MYEWLRYISDHKPCLKHAAEVWVLSTLTTWLTKAGNTHLYYQVLMSHAKGGEGASNTVEMALAKVLMCCDHLWQALLWYGWPYI